MNLLCVSLMWMSAASFAAENLQSIVAVQQAQIAALMARDKQHDEQLAKLGKIETLFSRFKQRNQVVSGLSGSGVVALPKIIMNDGGTYLISAVANQAGSSTTYFATFVRTTNGVVGATNIVTRGMDYVGSQIIKSVGSNNNGSDTILNLEYSGMLPGGSIDVTLWFLN